MRNDRARFGIGCLLLAAVLVASCSPGVRDRLVDALFDVPSSRPSSRDTPADHEPLQRSRAVAAALPFESVHPPFAAGRCRDCHDPVQPQFMAPAWQGRCLGCHPQSVGTQPYMHGPAGAFACTQCHAPHAAHHEHLLTRPAPAMCLHCHGPTFRAEGPWHQDASARCTDCHDPHQGPDERLLRPFDEWRSLAPGYDPERSAPSPAKKD